MPRNPFGWRKAKTTVDPRRQLLLFTVLGLVEVGFIFAAITAPGDGWRGATGIAIVLSMPLAFFTWALCSSKKHGSREEADRSGS